jgi:hypothetical protein
MSVRQLASGLFIAMGLSMCLPTGTSADISCDDFVFLEDAQAIIDGLGSDPYSLDEPRGSGADPNDGLLCEDRQTEESQLVPRPTSDDAGPPVLSDLSQDELPAGIETVEFQSATNEDFLYVKDTSGLFDNEYTIELIGIETPGWSERRAPDRDCFGEEVEAHFAELFPTGTTLYLEKDAAEHHDDESVSNDDIPLRYVWVQDDTDGRYYLLNGLMVREGLAVVAITPPNVKYASDLRAAQQEAIAEGAGLWGACAGVTYPPS